MTGQATCQENDLALFSFSSLIGFCWGLASSRTRAYTISLYLLFPFQFSAYFFPFPSLFAMCLKKGSERTFGVNLPPRRQLNSNALKSTTMTRLPGLQVAWKYVVSVFLLQWACLQELAPKSEMAGLSFAVLFFCSPMCILLLLNLRKLHRIQVSAPKPSPSCLFLP